MGATCALGTLWHGRNRMHIPCPPESPSRLRACLVPNFFLFLTTVALSFVFGKNCLIMDYLGLKDSSRQLQTNCVISYSFYLYLMLHACAARFDVTRNLKKFWFLGGI